MVLDEPTDKDQVFTQEGISYVVDSGLLERVKPIKVDFTDSPRGGGFIILSSLESACGSCSC
jgi:Fe-S cluster assembly iron-binding protein IscA